MTTPFKPHLPKADMHVHLEGTLTPALAARLAVKNGAALKPGLVSADGEAFCWKPNASARENLSSFVAAYDDACAVIKTADDYTAIAHDYLTRSAREGCIYAEVGISADHGASMGLSYPEMVDAIARGCVSAKEETGIEARLISTCVRHYGPARALKAAQETAAYQHPLVTGFGMAGDENAGVAQDFLPAFNASGLSNRTAHAGEAAGPESVRAAYQVLKCRRFGHMVRVTEDGALWQNMVDAGAVAEVCVSSNLCLRVYADYATHPLRRMFDSGLRVVLGSDDPAFFRSLIGREYEIAQTHFGFSDEELLRVTRTALERAFLDDATRSALTKRLR